MNNGPPFWLKVVGVLVILGFAGMLLSCALGDMRMQRCMRLSVFGAASYLLHLGSMALAIWIGVEAAKGTKRSWVGWVVAIVLILAFGVLLSWLGFESPRTGFDDDNNYRR